MLKIRICESTCAIELAAGVGKLLIRTVSHKNPAALVMMLRVFRRLLVGIKRHLDVLKSWTAVQDV